MNANKPENPPAPGKSVVLDAVIGDLLERSEHGAKKYGTPHMSHNRRNALLDAYQEALDLVMYVRQRLIEEEIH